MQKKPVLPYRDIIGSVIFNKLMPNGKIFRLAEGDPDPDIVQASHRNFEDYQMIRAEYLWRRALRSKTDNVKKRG